MRNKLFVTDCEGPLTINDNAYELAKEFIPDGDKLFEKLSNYDDILTDELKNEGYHAGTTLRYIIPFLIAYGVDNKKSIEFAKKTLKIVPNADLLLKRAEKNINSYIISTSYQQYIESLCGEVEFPVENTFFTKIDLDSFNLSQNETEEIKKLKDVIISANFDEIRDIFTNKISKMSIGDQINGICPVGGMGKLSALKEIIEKNNSSPEKVFYAGDSITDVEVLEYLKKNGGVAVSFNGNEFALKAADIAIIADDSIALLLILDLFFRFNSDYVKQFVDGLNIDLERTLGEFKCNHQVLDKFRETYKNHKLPIITNITNENSNELIKESLKSRMMIRGESIANLG